MTIGIAFRTKLRQYVSDAWSSVLTGHSCVNGLKPYTCLAGTAPIQTTPDRSGVGAGDVCISKRENQRRQPQTCAVGSGQRSKKNCPKPQSRRPRVRRRMATRPRMVCRPATSRSPRAHCGSALRSPLRSGKSVDSVWSTTMKSSRLSHRYRVAVSSCEPPNAAPGHFPIRIQLV